MSDKQHLLVNDLFHAVIDIERISDHAENLADLTKYKIEHDIVFSQRGQDELRQLFSAVLTGQLLPGKQAMRQLYVMYTE